VLFSSESLFDISKVQKSLPLPPPFRSLDVLRPRTYLVAVPRPSDLGLICSRNAGLPKNRSRKKSHNFLYCVFSVGFFDRACVRGVKESVLSPRSVIEESMCPHFLSKTNALQQTGVLRTLWPTFQGISRFFLFFQSVNAASLFALNVSIFVVLYGPDSLGLALDFPRCGPNTQVAPIVVPSSSPRNR